MHCPLRSKTDIIRTSLKQGRNFNTSFGTIKLLNLGPNDLKPSSLIAVIIPKKVTKLATRRNLIKRRIKHIIRELSKAKQTRGKQNNQRTPFITALVRKDISKLSYDNLKNEINHTLFNTRVPKDSFS